MKNKNKISLLIIALIVITFYNIYNHYSKVKLQALKKVFNDNFNLIRYGSSITSSNNTTIKNIAPTYYDQANLCEPFNKNPNQYQVTINGVTYPKIIPLRDNTTVNYNCINKRNKTAKVILLWTPFYDRPDFYYGIGKYDPFVKHGCPATNCEVTNDKNRLNESNLVVVSFQNQIDLIPSERNPNQQWVFIIIESPVHLSGSSHTQYNGLFNLAATYRYDADFMSHYAYESQLTWEDNKNFNENFNYYKDKTEFAAIIVSNCGGSSGRLKYVSEMQKYVSVSIFGACGRPCPTTFDNGTQGDCKEIVSSKYKFFLAFENSLCKDYITEKFFIILRYNIIPVVLGAGKYEDYIPKSGFINVLDFKSPKDLAEYLLYLDKNQTAYNSYFNWKRFVNRKHLGIFAAEICEFCIRLHIEDYTKKKKTSRIENIDQYWNGGDCRSVSEFPQLVS